ncbi:MAG: hypothetical protein ACYCTX_03505 [Thermoplasmataceae archaeon]
MLQEIIHCPLHKVSDLASKQVGPTYRYIRVLRKNVVASFSSSLEFVYQVYPLLFMEDV